LWIGKASGCKPCFFHWIDFRRRSQLITIIRKGTFEFNINCLLFTFVIIVAQKTINWKLDKRWLPFLPLSSRRLRVRLWICAVLISWHTPRRVQVLQVGARGPEIVLSWIFTARCSLEGRSLKRSLLSWIFSVWTVAWWVGSFQVLPYRHLLLTKRNQRVTCSLAQELSLDAVLRRKVVKHKFSRGSRKFQQ
jgi:hypothetical protein